MIDIIKRNAQKILGIVMTLTLVTAVFSPMFAQEGVWTPDAENGKGWFYDLETTYCGTVRQQGRHEEIVEEKYGKAARDLFVQGLKTGDMVPFRTKIGDFKTNIGTWVKGSTPGTTNPSLSLAETVFSNAKTWLGPYATAQDYISWASGLGYNVFDIDSRNKFGADLVLGKVARPAEITKAQYQKNHGSVAVTPAASNNQVESLKTYKGNNAEFNAYNYYSRYPDLQAAIGANGDALLKHYNEHGKAEGRNASSPVN